MELRKYGMVFFKWSWLIVLGIVLAAGAAYAVARSTPPVYQASTKLMAISGSGLTQMDYSALITGQELARTYGELLKTRPVLDRVVQKLQLPMTADALREHMSVVPIQNTQLIVLFFEDEDPVTAANIANQIAQECVEQYKANQISRLASAIIVVEPAIAPSRPIRPNVVANTLLAAIVGAMLTIGVAFLVEYLDDSIRSSEDVDRAFHLPILGLILQAKVKTAPERLIIQRSPYSPAAEAYRALRTNVQFANVDDPPKTILVTSTNPLEGKSITAVNLAAVMAQSGLSVALVDADLHRPTLHTIFEVPNNCGLTDVLLQGENALDESIHETHIEGLHLIPTGPLPPNPSELLGSHRMRQLTTALKQRFDAVIFDSPPVLAVTDPVVLAPQADGVILVVMAGKTRRGAAQRAIANLTHVKCRPLGVVLNKVAERRGIYGHQYYSAKGKKNRQPAPVVTLSRWNLVGSARAAIYRMTRVDHRS